MRWYFRKGNLPFKAWPLRLWVLSGVVVAAIVLLCIWQIGSIPTGFNQAEINARQASSSLQVILSDPSFLLHKIPQYLLQKMSLQGPVAMRGVSITLAAVAVFCFWYIASYLFNRLIAIVSSLFFVSTPLFMLAARSATPDILYITSVLAVFACSVWALRSRRRGLALIVFVTCLGLMLYTPGILWFLIVGYILLLVNPPWIRIKVKRWLPYAVVFWFIALIIPLGIALYRQPDLIKNLLLIPDKFVPQDHFTALAQSASGLFWRTAEALPFRIGQLPVLSFISIPIFVLGLIGSFKLWRWRSVIVVITIVLTTILVGLSGNHSLILYALLPIMIGVAGGLSWLLGSWNAVFPINSLARNFALTLVGIVAVVQLLYGFRASFVAWPHIPSVKSSHVLQ